MGALLDSVRTKLFGQPVLQQTGVADELLGAGTAFADLIEGVGKAVADTQRELDATAGAIASDMAKLQVDIVQAVVSNYDDNGNLTTVEVVPGKTSALSIAVPPALSFKRVHLEGSFVASEFSATSTSNVNINLVGVSAGRGFGASVVNANTNIASSQTQDVSVGTMSMTAQILPKPVTALPTPPLVFKGPSLALSIKTPLSPAAVHQTPALPPATDAPPPYLEMRSMVLQVQLNDVTGTAITGKTIAVDGGGLDWGLTDSTGTNNNVTSGPTTDSSGQFFILVSRTATSSTDPKKDYVIRASLNLVNATLGISL